MTRHDPPDPLQPVLQDAEATLSRRLHEACEAESQGLSNKTSEEIREIEDSLLAAAVAAGQTIALRRYMKKRDDVEGSRDEHARDQEAAVENQPSDPDAADVVGGSAAASASTLREFRDSGGQMWRAWPVIPGISRTGRPQHYLGEYQRGWVCFEALDSSSRRRLPCAPTRLAETKDEELELLLQEAITAPERKTIQKPA